MDAQIEKQLGENQFEVLLIAEALRKKFCWRQQTISILEKKFTKKLIYHAIIKTISPRAQKVLWDLLKSEGTLIGVLPQDMSFVIHACVKFYMVISRVFDAPETFKVRLFADVFESFNCTKTYSIYVDKWNYSEEEFQSFANIDEVILEIERMISIVC